jgi:excinuclease ABC subunit B
MKKIHVSAINRKVRDDEKLFVEECDRKYNEKLVAIADSIEISDKAENAKLNTRRMGRMEREAAIERLTREMKEAAKLLEFEHAAFLRDQIDRLRRGENPTVDSAAETERKQNHSQTQRKGRKYLGKR